MSMEFGKGIGVSSGFDLGTKGPLDSRITVATIADRDAHSTKNRAYEGMLVYVEADKTLYQFVDNSWKPLLKDLKDKLDSIENQLGLGGATGEGSINDRINALEAKDTELYNKINSEEQARTNADNNIKNSINGEINRAKSTEEKLQSDIDNEITTRIQNISDLQDQINNINLNIGETGDLGAQVKANKEAIEVINGEDTQNGSIAKALKDAKTYADTELAKKADKEHGTHLTLGTGSGNAFRGDYGNTAYQHSQAAHAPSDAQKNSDITQEEIEAKLTGRIYTHNHSRMSFDDNTHDGLAQPIDYDRGVFFNFSRQQENRFNGLEYSAVQTIKPFKTGDAGHQFVYPYNDDTARNKIFYRSKLLKDSGWGEWAEIYTSLNKPTASDIGAAPAEHGTHLTLGTGSGNAFRGDYGNAAYNHSQAAHAPSNAQKNSDITKTEIEAKLTGNITSHTHNQYLTQHQDISGKANVSDLTSHTENTSIHITTDERRTWNNKAEKTVATIDSDGLMGADMVTKLNNIADGANNYKHPSTHAATMIIEDTTHRFVTDTDKSNWNNKVNTSSSVTANHIAVFNDTTGKVIKDSGFTIATSVPANAKFTDTTYTADAGIKLNGTTFQHTNSVTAGTAQGDANKTLTFGGTFTIPTVTYDAQGHITGKGTTTMTMPATPTSVSGNAGSASKVNNSIKVQLNGGTTEGTNQFTFDGSAAKNINITPSSIGAATTSTATTSANGLMSSTDKSKLDGIAAGANKTTVDSSISDTSTNPIQNKVIKSYVDTKVADIVDSAPETLNTLKELSTALGNNPNFATTIATEIGTKANASDLTAHIGDATHITAAERTAWNAKSNLALGTTSATAFRGDYGNTAYTHSQAAHAPSNAQKNSDITKAEIEEKLTGNITTHTHNYAGSSSAGGAATSANKVNANLVVKLNNGSTEGTNLFTFNGSAAKNINITPSSIGAATTSVVTTSANGLMSSTDKSKLDGIAANANNYSHPTYTSKTSGLYKVTVDNTGHVSATTAVTKADITGLGIPGSDTTYSVATTSANGLMSSTDKSKLDGIATNANNYSHPTYTSKTSGLYKVTVDSTGHVSATTAVTKADITGLGIPGSDTTYSVATTSANGLMSSTDKSKLDGIATNANNYSHPTTSGNKHIPSGGSSGQILRWSADGTAVWGNDNNTTYSTGTASASGLTKLYTSTGTATDGTMTQNAIKSALDGKAASSHTHDSLMATDLTSKTVSLNDYNLSSGTPKVAYYFCPTDGGGSNITGRPNDSAKQAFNLIVESLRFASTTDYITKQTYTQGSQKTTYVRYCTNGTWSAWEKVYTSVQKPTVSEIGAAASSHTHNYAGSSSAGGAATSANKVNTNLVVKLNGGTSEGTNLFTFNGSAAKNINITPSSIGAATTSTATTSANGLMSSTDKSKLDGIATNANNYSHPTASGNKHIPSGGSSGQILRWSADGTAVWGNDNNTTYSADTGIKLNGTTFQHTNSVTAGTAQGDANKTLTFGGTFTIPTVTYDAQGHITSKGTTTMTMPATPTSVSGNAGSASKVNNNIKIQLNGGTTEGTNQFTFNGSAAKNINITPSSIGAATTSTATTSANGLMSSTDKSKLDGIATNANNYSHPTTSGNKHIPSGGSSGQILRWSADGTATWGADNNTATAASNILSGSNSGTQITYAPYTAQQAKLSFDTSTTNPTRTDRLNLNGNLHATNIASNTVKINGKVNMVYNSTTESLDFVFE